MKFITSGVDNSFDPTFSCTDYIYKDKGKLVVNSVLSARQLSMEFLYYMPYSSNVPKEIIVETRGREEAKSK